MNRETRMTPGVVQRALKTRGFDLGPIEGFIGRVTVTALNRLRRARGVPVDGDLNIQSVQALGVQP